MAPEASPFISPRNGASPVLAPLPVYLVRFLSPSAPHNKPYLGLRVKSRKPLIYGRQNMQFSRHSRVIYGKLGGNPVDRAEG